MEIMKLFLLQQGPGLYFGILAQSDACLLWDNPNACFKPKYYFFKIWLSARTNLYYVPGVSNHLVVSSAMQTGEGGGHKEIFPGIL